MALQLPQRPCPQASCSGLSWAWWAAGHCVLGWGPTRVRRGSDEARLWQDSARPEAVTRAGASPGSLCSLSLWTGSGLEGGLHPHMGQGAPKSWFLLPQSFGLPLPQVSRLALSGLRNWMTAASPSATFAARHFRPFLPPRGQVELGEPWWIIPSELSVFTGYLSNNRFYPPPPKGKEVRTAHSELLGPAPCTLAQAQPLPICLWTSVLPHLYSTSLWIHLRPGHQTLT